MHILICNDDGIHAKGLATLARAAAPFGQLTVVAPHRERSAIGHAISLHRPLRVLPQSKPNWFALDGTPTDCAYIGCHHILDTPPDLFLSGINHGPNLGTDVLYSGTVGAAMEATRDGIPALAFSLASRKPNDTTWQQAERVATQIIEWFLQQPPLPRHRLLNVNIPGTLMPSPAPTRITRLGEVTYPNHVEARTDPRGQPYYWIGGIPPVYSKHHETDCVAIEENVVSITPLKLDLTDLSLQETLQRNSE